MTFCKVAIDCGRGAPRLGLEARVGEECRAEEVSSARDFGAYEQ